MPRQTWEIFNKAKALAQSSASADRAEKVDAMLSAAMEAIADALPTASVKDLQEGAAASREALDAFERLDGVDEQSPSFFAGRLASAVDLLGYASYQTADEAIVEVARRQPYAAVVAELAKEPQRNVELARRLGKDEAQISKWLGTLRECGAVSSHRRGRELFSSLTPVGRLVVEAGWQDERRAPVETINVVDLAASRFNMNTKMGPDDVEASPFPLLSAAG